MSIRVARKRPDTYQHGDLHAALIQAGLKLLGEQGERGLSLRAAAQLAGVSHAAPYRHFRDKNALIAAIAERGFRLLTASLRAEIDAAPPADPVGRLRAAAWGYVSFARAHPAYFRTIFSDFVRDDGADTSAALAEAGAEAYAVLRDLVAEGIRRGRLRRGDPDQLSLAAWSMVHGLSFLLINQQLPDADQQEAARGITDGVIRLLETGLRAP
jgi:AcrR family transcriptional regulator